MPEYECKVCNGIMYTLQGAVKHRLAMHGELMDESDIHTYFNELEWQQ